MKFNTVAEAFNFYKNKTVAELEKRAAEIKHIIDTDSNADVNAFNIELGGIAEAKKNIEERSGNPGAGFNVITGAGFDAGKKSFTAETVESTPEYRSAFFKTLMGRKLTEAENAAFKLATEKRADAFNTSANAAAVLPTETLNEVIKKARTIGGLIAECRAFNMPTKIAIPIGTPASKASWHTEGAAVDTDKASVATVSFDGYEIIKIFSISVKVAAMSVAAFEAYLVDELTACVMECIADALINGTGSSQGKGLDKITWNKAADASAGTVQNAVEVAKASSVTYANVVKVVSLLKRGYSAGAKWAMNNATLYNVFYGMVDSNGRPIFVADPKAESIGKILGFEVVVDDNIADDVAYFGNFAKYLGYNLANGITIEASRESSFKSGLIDYRAMAVADCKPLVDEAFIKLYKATT